MDAGSSSTPAVPNRRGRRRRSSEISIPHITNNTYQENRCTRRARINVASNPNTVPSNIQTDVPSLHAETSTAGTSNDYSRQQPSSENQTNPYQPNSGEASRSHVPNATSSGAVPSHKRTIFEPLNLGTPSCTCTHCGASFWYEERLRRERHTPNPKYNLCCKGGRISLPPYQQPPQPLLSLLTSDSMPDSRHFFDHIRQYNSMFAMTSMGARVINSINDGHGPYVFKISGQVCHRIGSMIPSPGERPEYAQLYLFDTEHEVSNRSNIASSSRTPFHVNETIVQSLIQMLDAHNPIVRLFRTARERIADNSSDHYRIRIFGDVDAHGDIFSAPVASEVVGLVAGDIGHTNVGRDIIIEDHASNLQQIDEKHRKFMSMQHPLLFPYGEDGFHDNIMYQTNTGMRRQKATMAEYYSYRLHDRANDFNTPLRCGRGTQAYLVDGYCCVERERIDHFRTKSFQQKYRSASYSSLSTSVASGITSGSSVGQRIILPPSFTGSPRYLYQKYQDCIGICRKFGCPDLFVTFTSNASWAEVAAALPPGLTPSDRPDIVDRVFQMKLNILMDDIKKRNFFGPINAVVYTIEFQKRGLPHAHIIIWLKKESSWDAAMVDTFISAQLPNPTSDPIGYEAVSSFMVHGPCGPQVTYSPCMADGKCTKFNPKQFCEETSILENGFAQYARPNNGILISKNGIDVDNRFIVPHNVDLVVKFQAHINVERVNRDGMHKYLFKYVTKGFDCARIGIQRGPSTTDPSEHTVNEIDNFLECRCVTPNDAAWRLFQYDIHHSHPSVERLPVHLPLENNVVFTCCPV